jgi:hypothetical protein
MTILSRRCRIIAFSALLLLACIGPACFGQTVKIHVVDSASEKPLMKQTVSISGITGKEDTQKQAEHKLLTKPTTPDLRLVTDINGDAQFELPKPAPANFYVRAELYERHWDCVCLVRVSTEELMQKGYKTTNAYDKAAADKPSDQPKPGEILFHLGPTPWWVRAFWPLLTDHRR